MTIHRIATLPLALLLTVAMHAPSSQAAETPTSGSAGHATHGAQPGTHEDWCGEHEVPESQCTRCNPALIPAFKATNDWCEEHGLPESQCKACNPDLKTERPPKSGTKPAN